jgi:D-glycero-D-manno-heptose 1,7-bisphosphate phosphatase
MMDGAKCRRAVFLDRDGVLNRAPVVEGLPRSPKGLDELEILPGVAGALGALRAAGFALVVVTNQPEVARGRTTREAVEQIHARLRRELPLDAIQVCYHDDADACGCRKPAPGMILEAARALGLDAGSSYLVGDRWRDIEAGRRAGCSTVLVSYPYAEAMMSAPDACVGSLAEAADWILARERARGGA